MEDRSHLGAERKILVPAVKLLRVQGAIEDLQAKILETEAVLAAAFQASQALLEYVSEEILWEIQTTEE